MLRFQIIFTDCLFLCVQDGETPCELAAAKGHAAVVGYLTEQSDRDMEVSEYTYRSLLVCLDVITDM